MKYLLVALIGNSFQAILHKVASDINDFSVCHDHLSVLLFIFSYEWGLVHPGQLVGPRKSLNGREKIPAKKSQEGEEEPLGTRFQRTSSKRSG